MQRAAAPSDKTTATAAAAVAEKRGQSQSWACNQTLVRRADLARPNQPVPSRLPTANAAQADDTGLANQRETSAVPISVSGQELPELAKTGPVAKPEDAEDGDLALQSIERGSGPTAGAAPPNPASPPDDPKKAVQTKAAIAPAAPAAISPGAVLSQLGASQPLAPPLRTRMEGALGSGFGGVRVHADARAASLATALGAHAFTIGEHIAFGAGRYRPEEKETERLVAHELTHVVQQRRGLSGEILSRGIGSHGDAYEREADRNAARVAATRDAPADAASPSVTAEGGAAAPEALQLFSGSAAAAYATAYATKSNPAYVRFDNDCTNFVSQSMLAGGWSMIFGSDVCDKRKDDDVWWYKKDGCERKVLSNVDASFTWGGAHNFFKFAGASGRAKSAANVNNLEVGDVLQRDHGDGHIHHSMVVTQKGTDKIGDATIKQFWVSYHSNDTLNRKFFGPGGFHETTESGWKYFGWNIS